MKRGSIIWIATLAFVLGSCTTERRVSPGGAAETLKLRFEVEDISGGAKTATRASIPAEDGETQINSLYLLFYENRSDGSGAWVKTLTGAELGVTPAMNASYEIPFEGTFSADMAYTILALANLDAGGSDTNGYLDGQTVAQYIGMLEGMNEKQAVERTTIAVSGVDAVETDDTKAIKSDNLFMSCRVVRRNTDAVTLIKLVRGVARLDIYIDESLDSDYELVSTSVWGAAPEAPVWYDKMTEVPARMRRFFGVKKSVDPAYFGGNQLVGHLYALENFVANPETNDRVTTCVIIGLNKLTGAGAGQTCYYRVNVRQMESSQDLKRNNVYKIRVNSVDGSGSDNEYSAWSQSRTQLNVSINEWNVDDNGMVLTDGVNTMVLPVKLIRLDALGDVREYSIFTIGGATLSISKNELPAGIRAELIGSLLRITADPLPANQNESRGSIELSFGSLRGAISVVQTPDESLCLTLNRYDVPNYAPLGRNGTSDNVPFTVTASGSWTAKIYNMDDDEYNPGFSFNPSGAPVTTLNSLQNPFGNSFQVYTTGDNGSSSDERNGFVMLTLDDDPSGFNRVVVLTQDPKTEIILTPNMPTTLRFSPTGVPNGQAGGTAAGGYTFDIDPGMTGGVPNAWSISPGTGDTQYFDVEKIAVGGVNRFIVKAKGTTTIPYPYPDNNNRHMNLLGRELEATYTIQVGSQTLPFVVNQSRMGISVSTQGTEVSKGGGTTGDVTVNIDPTLHWTAEIVDGNYAVVDPQIRREHKAFLMLGNTKMGETIAAGQTQATRLKVGFDKIYYPLVNETPTVNIKVSLEENPSVSTTFTVTQQPLTPAPMNILDVRNTSYGCITGGGHYLTYYRSYLDSPTLFGVNGHVKTATALKKTGQAADPSVIAPEYRYLHVGGQPGADYTQARHTAVNDWWTRYGSEGIVLYAADNSNDHLFANSTGGSKRTTVLSMLGITGSGYTGSTPVLNTAMSDRPVYKYLVQHGPFGASGTFGLVYLDGVSSRVHASSLPANAVPLIVDQNNSNNVLLFIDPENNVAYWGESQMFDIYIDAPALTLAGTSTSTYKNLSCFMANMQAYIINAAQYGSHFTELFLPDNEDAYNDAFVD